MNTLTRRQQQLLDLIRAYIDDHGAPPTRMELATRLGVRAVSTVDQHLQALATKGYLDLRPGLNRNIRLLDAANAPDSSDHLPLIGRVAAGAPILAEQHIESRYRIDPALFDPQADYLLRVRGMSMRDAGILEGDLLAVHSGIGARESLKHGQIVVARIDDQVTVKRFAPHPTRPHLVQLLPENPDFDLLEIDLRHQTFTIEGIAVGIIRNNRL